MQPKKKIRNELMKNYSLGGVVTFKSKDMHKTTYFLLIYQSLANKINEGQR